jgi:hypothetical protein
MTVTGPGPASGLLYFRDRLQAGRVAIGVRHDSQAEPMGPLPLISCYARMPIRVRRLIDIGEDAVPAFTMVGNPLDHRLPALALLRCRGPSGDLPRIAQTVIRAGCIEVDGQVG